MILFSIFLLTFTSCANIYQASDASSLIREHKLIAIVTPDVLISPQSHIRPEALKHIQFGEAVKLQYEMYDWILRRKMQKRFMEVEVQNIELTNKKLKESGFFDNTIISEKELCEILEVDAIITSNYTLNTPFSTVGEVVNGILTDDWQPVKETTVLLSLYDQASSKHIWNYRSELIETSYSNASTFVQSFMHHASKRMPYSLK